MSSKVFGHRFKNFRLQGSGGFGVLAHELIRSLHTARVRGYQFGFLRNGLAYPELFGSRNWLDYFDGEIIDSCDVEWPNILINPQEPGSFKGSRREWYRKLARELMVLRPEIQKEIDEMIAQTGFQNSDCVMHVRRTDKVSESTLNDLNDYVEAVVRHVPLGTRIFLLTDDPAIRTDMQERLQQRSYPLVWDEEDTTIHCQRIGNDSYLGKNVPKGPGSSARGILGKFSDDQLRRETMTAIKLITMMSRAQYLIGARISMLFRIGEILSDQSTFSLRDFSYVGINDFFWPYLDPVPNPIRNPIPKPELKVKRKVFGHRFKNFRLPGTGGLGMLFHELILSLHTARAFNFKFGFLRNGLMFPEIFGSQNWLDYFEGEIVETCDLEWPKLTADYCNPPNFDGDRREWFQKLAREIFVLRPEIQKEIGEMISRTGFHSSDCVVHVRRTDKVSETALNDLEDYVNAISKHVPVGTRIFLLTDDPAIRTDMQKRLQQRGYPLVWDEEDTTIHCERIGNDSYLGKKNVPQGVGSQAVGIIGKFSDKELRREILTVIKLIVMMSKARYLVGARVSMLFRVGEVLNTQTTVNLKDFDKWPCQFVEQYRPKFSSFGDFRKVILPDFLNGPVSQLVKTSLQQFRWWKTISGLNYQRSDPNSRHYLTCNCCLCSLKGNLEEKSFQKRLEQLSGKTFGGYQDICLIRVEASGSILEQFSTNLLLLSLSDDDGGQLMTAGSATRIAPKFGQLVLIQNPGIVRIEPVKNQLLFLRAGVLLH